MYGLEKPIPPCSSCGASRVFELQLLPSLLHVLEVDKHASTSNSSDSPLLRSAYDNGGMDWGNIAIYSCPNAACKSTEEYCVVQDSVDERPTDQQRVMGQGDVVIQEDAKFDDDDDELEGMLDGDDEVEGMLDGDDDDDSW
jgi:Programmed cell death protein 2, C-terminal putative domain